MISYKDILHYIATDKGKKVLFGGHAYSGVCFCPQDYFEGAESECDKEDSPKELATEECIACWNCKYKGEKIEPCEFVEDYIALKHVGSTIGYLEDK